MNSLVLHCVHVQHLPISFSNSALFGNVVMNNEIILASPLIELMRLTTIGVDFVAGRNPMFDLKHIAA